MESTEKYKKLEKALYRSRERYRKLIENLPDAVFIHDNKKVLFANSAASKLAGVKNYRELVGMDIYQFVVPDRREYFKELYNRVIKENRNLPFQEEKFIRVDGTILDAEFTAAPFSYRNRKVMLVTMRDITERKLAEQERSRIFNLSIDMLCAANFEGYFLEVNPAWEKSLGFTHEELLSKPYIEFVHPEDVNATLTTAEDLSKGISTKNFENRYLCKDGSYKWVSWNSVPDLENGLFYSVARDITERKQAERIHQLLTEALEYDKLKTEFFANISHELRTPLNIILSTLQLIDSFPHTCPEGKGRMPQYVKVMKQNCYRLLRLINNIIDITKIDSGFYELRLENQDIVSIVEDITLSAANYANTRGIELVFDTETEEKILACDADKIERIMLNLLSNAIKFTDFGGTISVDVYDKGKNVLISVKDTGTGIEEEKLDIIFERFRQADMLLTRNHEGSGIGLSLVKSLVEMHGGKVSARSTYGKGSEFLIKLPVRLVDEVGTKRYSTSRLFRDNSEKFNIEFSDISYLYGEAE